jgi:hypothetical protein
MERFQYRTSSRWRTEYILQPGYDFGDKFEFGLRVILDALTKFLQINRLEA